MIPDWVDAAQLAENTRNHPPFEVHEYPMSRLVVKKMREMREQNREMAWYALRLPMAGDVTEGHIS